MICVIDLKEYIKSLFTAACQMISKKNSNSNCDIETSVYIARSMIDDLNLSISIYGEYYVSLYYYNGELKNMDSDVI